MKTRRKSGAQEHTCHFCVHLLCSATMPILFPFLCLAFLEHLGIIPFLRYETIFRNREIKQTLDDRSYHSPTPRFLFLVHPILLGTCHTVQNIAKFPSTEGSITSNCSRVLLQTTELTPAGLIKSVFLKIITSETSKG